MKLILEAATHDYRFITEPDAANDFSFMHEHEFLSERFARTLAKHGDVCREYATASRGFAKHMLTIGSSQKVHENYKNRVGRIFYHRMEQRRKGLERAFAEAPALGIGLNAYSGLNVPFGKSLIKLQPGQTIKNKTVISSSIDPGVAHSFMKAGKMRAGTGIVEQALLHMDIPPEAKGLYIAGVSPNPSEYELILPYTTQLEITGIHSIALANPRYHGGAERRTMISAKVIPSKSK